MGGSSNREYFQSQRSTSGPSSGRGGGSGSGSDHSCDIASTGTLRSPPPAVVSGLSIGMELAIGVLKVAGVDVLQANHPALGPAGSVDSPDEQALLECLSRGYRYKAVVARVQGAVVAVQIGPA